MTAGENSTAESVKDSRGATLGFRSLWWAKLHAFPSYIRHTVPRCICSGVNSSVTLGMDWRKREGILGTEVTQWGPGAKTNKGSSGRTPNLILISEMDVKLIFHGEKK